MGRWDRGRRGRGRGGQVSDYVEKGVLQELRKDEDSSRTLNHLSSKGSNEKGHTIKSNLPTFD